LAGGPISYRFRDSATYILKQTLKIAVKLLR